MASSAGKLIVEIIATTATFQSDLGKASAAAETHARRIDRALAGVKASVVSHLAGAAAAVGGAFGAAAFVNLVRGTIEAQDHLLQLSRATGVSVEQLGGLGFAASQTGGNLDDMALAFRKFNVNIAEAAAGNEKQIENFRALGISLKELQTVNPGELFIKAAGAFASFEDDANKAARASLAFGRSYQGILPTLDQGSEKLRQNIAYFERFGGVSTETAQRASQFKEELSKASLLAGAFGRTLTAELLPGMQALVKEFVSAREKGAEFNSVAEDVAAVIKGIAVAVVVSATEISALGHAFGAIAAQAEALSHLDFARVLAIQNDITKEQEARFERMRRLIAAINADKKELERPSAETPGARRKTPPLVDKDATDAAKKQLETALRALDIFISSEQELLRQRETFLQDYYQNDELGIQDFFDRRAAAMDEALSKIRSALDEEEELIRTRISKAKPTERAEDEKLLADVIGKRAKVEQTAAAENVKGFILQGRAARDFRDKVEELGIAEAEARGDPGAAAARFDFEHRQIVAQLQVNVDSANEIIALQARVGLAAIESGKARALAQDQVNQATRDFATLLGGIEVQQSRIDLEVATGNKTEIEGLNARSALALRYTAILEGLIVKAQEAINRPGITGAEKDATLLAIDQMRLRIQQLAADSDLLAKKFRDVFESDFADALLAAETGAKSLKDVIKDLGKAIENDLLRIANKNIAETLFGKGGALGGIPDFFAGLFGGKGALGGTGKDTGAAFTDAASLLSKSGLTMDTAGLSLNTAGIALNTSAVALSAAAVALGASSTASTAGSALGALTSGLFDPIAGAALGGPISGPTIVGERGPELFIPRQSGTVIPHDVLVGRRSARHQINNITINVPAGTSGATADQIAAATMRALRRGQRNL